MGIEYKPHFCVGKIFDEKSEAIDYCIEKGLCTDDDIDNVGGYLDDVEFIDKNIRAELLDGYSGYGYTVGYQPSVRDVDNFAKNVKEAQEKWLALTGDKAEIIHSVCIY